MGHLTNAHCDKGSSLVKSKTLQAVRVQEEQGAKRVTVLLRFQVCLGRAREVQKCMNLGSCEESWQEIFSLSLMRVLNEGVK